MEDFNRNQAVVDWARSNLVQPVEIKPITQNRLIMALTYGALFLFPALFMLVGVLLWLLGSGSGTDRTAQRTFFCGLVMLIPLGLIVLVGYFVRRSFAGYLDADGVSSQSGMFLWKDLMYVNHVTKYVDRGGTISDRKIKDNNLDLVFTQGSVTIPPLIKNKARIWNLIHSIPCEHRKG